MAVLLLAEINDGELSMDQTAKAVSAATALGDVTVLACGATCSAAAAEAATALACPRCFAPKTHNMVTVWQK